MISSVSNSLSPDSTAQQKKRLRKGFPHQRAPTDTWHSACRQSWGRLYTRWKSTSWGLAPKQEKSHLESVSSCPARKTCQHAGALLWNLFRIGVEPLGQPELSLPAEEKDKLDCHLRFLVLFSPMHENWECACLARLSPPLCVAWSVLIVACWPTDTDKGAVAWGRADAGYLHNIPNILLLPMTHKTVNTAM